MSNSLDNHNNEIRRKTSEALEAVEALKKRQKEDQNRRTGKIILFCLAALVIFGSLIGIIFIEINRTDGPEHCALSPLPSNWNYGTYKYYVVNEYTANLPSTIQGTYGDPSYTSASINGSTSDRITFAGNKGDVIYITMQYPDMEREYNIWGVILSEPSGNISRSNDYTWSVVYHDIPPTTLSCTGTYSVYIVGVPEDSLTKYSVHIEKK